MSVQVSRERKTTAGSKSFNTSYVSVQASKQRSLGYTDMGFNTSYVSVQVNAAGREDVNGQFQYILCVGSRLQTALLHKHLPKRFNTSYVSVQVDNILMSEDIIKSFNTSYVSVQD